MFLRNHAFAALLLLMLFSVGWSPSAAQGWQTHFVDARTDVIVQKVDQFSNGDFVGVCPAYIPSYNFTSIYLCRFDVNGDTLWSRFAHPGLNASYGAAAVREAHDGGIVTAFSTNISQMGTLLAKFKPNGDSLWMVTVPGAKFVSDMEVAPNGDLVLTGYSRTPLTGPFVDEIWLARFDSMGTMLWDTTRSFGTPDKGVGIEIMPNGDLAVFARVFTGAEYRPYLLRHNANGNLLWSRNYYNGNVDLPKAMEQTASGGFVFMGNYQQTSIDPDMHLYVYKTDSQGDTLWRRKFLTPAMPGGWDIQETTCGDIACLAVADAGAYTLGYAMLLDSAGNLKWTKWLGNHAQIRTMVATQDSGIVVGGVWYQDTITPGVYLAKLDKQGNIFTNKISGYLYEDLNSNCQFDLGELPLANALLQVAPSYDYTTTDANGYYEFLVNPGTHDVLAWPPGLYYGQTCPANPLFQTVSFSQPYDTISGIDFAFEETVSCPLMTVSVGTPFLRRCSTSTYVVQYCNTGTAVALNASVEIELDSFLTVLSAGLPWQLPQNGNTYVFNLGNVPAGVCDTFSIRVDLSCSALFGQTHCVEAHVYPDSLCLPLDPQWDGSSLSVEGACDVDSIRFKIRNEGANNMTQPGGYVILEDNILRFNTTGWTLNAGDSLEVVMPANGSTWMMRVNQSIGHPGFSHPIAFVEACGTNSTGGVSLGFVTQAAMDDLDPFRDVFCLENTAAVDPNDKRVFPGGYGQEHNVFQQEHFEYMIRFQNTGTDTAFRVVIRDTLTSDLDVATFQAGVSSHAYTYRIYGQGIVEWTFDGILLPDSSTNLSASQGFVKFVIDRDPNLPVGTRINNNASIYFDYAAPVATGIAFVTLGEELWAMVNIDPEIEEGLPAQIKVYPNPMEEYAVFQLEEAISEFDLEVFDLQGKRIHHQHLTHTDHAILKRNELRSGLYVFRVSTPEGVLGTGRIVVY